jgi:hypothetical protein
MATRTKATSAVFGMLMTASLVVGCGSNQVSIGEQNADASAGGASGKVDAPVSGAGSTASSSSIPEGGASQVGGSIAVGGNSGAAGGSSIMVGGNSLLGGSSAGGASGGMLVGGASLLGGSTGGSKSSGSLAPNDRCGGIAGLKCASGSFCDYGACAVVVTDAMGTCVVRPEVCLANVDPVCGCDGKTYSNDCLRRLAGIGKASDGACGGTGGTGGKTATGGTGGSASGGTTGSSSSTGTLCSSDATCSTGDFCDLLIGNCGLTLTHDPAGTCVNKAGTGACTAMWQPVCGCDGKTYGNDCERILFGVSKKSEGECPKADGGVSDAGSASAALCSATGGEVKTQSCCTSVSDFPDFCVTGACGCAPTSSHVISVCSCPNGCFIPGTGCVGNSGICTVGVDHSCNDNPNLASIHGRCVTGGRCVCSKEFPLLANGKCL